MHKIFVAVCLILLFVLPYSSMASTEVAPVAQKDVGLDLCGICVNLADQTIQQLLNIILNIGVVGSCAKLCSYLPKELEQAACNLVCDVVGIELFIKALKKIGPDPIFYCQELKLCPIHDCEGTCAAVDSVDVAPPSGRRGSTFNIMVNFEVFNQTGTGEIQVVVVPPNAAPFGDGVLVPKGYQPGAYQLKFSLRTQPTENEPFTPGTYIVKTAICQGMCGSKHAHARVLATGQGSFDITP